MTLTERPPDLFAREHEWEALDRFVRSDRAGMRIGVVSGRRRQGKSFLLRRLAARFDGLYHQAQEVERPQALARFAADVARRLALPDGAVSFSTWEDALRVALGLPRPGAAGAGGAAGSRRLVVLDEFPYLLGHSPELPSVLRQLYDEAQDGAVPGSAVIVCGSALSVMTDILSGTKPLRGRAQLDLTLGPFDHRTARRYWGVGDLDVAFQLNAILGGTAGYRALVDEPPPGAPGDFPGWLARTVLNPAHALFGEADYLLREDPRIRDKATYNSILSAIAGGRHSQKEIGAVLERNAAQLRHPLELLESAGFIHRTEDMLVSRRPTYFLADPIVRFAQVVLEPNRPFLEERQVETAWQRAVAGYSSQVLGPHFEHLAREWTAGPHGVRWGVNPGAVGPAVINDARGRSRHQVDVLAFSGDGPRAGARAPIAVLGEAKATARTRGPEELRRLESLRALLADQGYTVAGCRLAVFSYQGFAPALVAEASRRPDVELIDLERLYE